MISDNIPEGFRAGLEVVSCYVECEEKILLLQRHPEHKHSSKWGLPAGKMEPGESPIQAMVRELQEETGLIADESNLHYREVLFVSYKGKEFLYHVFHLQLTEEPAIKINPPEHAEYGWFTVPQALSIDFIHDLDACIERHYGNMLIAEVS